jgi:6-phosphogluconolactonase (cycloisomerase 2 family)
MNARFGWSKGCVLLTLLAASGCNDDKDPAPAPPAPAATFTVGGSVSGLTGSVTLANNGGDARTVSANGGFTFATALTSGSAYSVTITSQPANQTCTVTSGSGNVAGNVSNVAVACVTNTFSVGGTVTGLAGSVTLTNNGGDARTVNADGAFTFATSLTNGAAYAVAVGTQPANQTCTVASATGNIAAANVASIAVTCSTYRVVASIGPAGGTLTHPDGAEVEIPAGALTQATDIAISRPASGWPTPLPEVMTPSDSIYEFTPHDIVFAKPVIIRIPAPANTTDVFAFVSSFDAGWSESDFALVGNRLELERNTFSWASGAGLACAGHPEPYFCVFPSGHAWATGVPAGTIMMTSGANQLSTGAPFTGVGSAGTWAVDGTQLTSVNLHMGYRAAPDCANGEVTLKRIVIGPPNVPQVITTQPAPLVNGKGRVTLTLQRNQLNDGLNTFSYQYHCTRPNKPRAGGADFITLDVTPEPLAGFTIGGTITGLNSAGLELQNGPREILSVAAGSGAFTFSTLQAPGSAYSVTVANQPANALCTLANRAGTANANVTNIEVSCTPTSAPTFEYTVVANGNAGSATLFGRAAGAGSMTSLDTRVTGSTPVSIVIKSGGPFVYVGNQVQGTITSFRIDNTTNTLNLIPLSSPNSPNTSALALDALSGSFLWATNFGSHTVSTFSIDPVTGVLTPVGTVSAVTFPNAIASHPNGNFVYVGHSSNGGALAMFSVNRTTGELTSIGTVSNAVSTPTDLLISPNGNFAYALSASNGSISRLQVNPATGAVSVLGFTGVSGASNCEALAQTPGGGILYASCSSSLGTFVQAYTVDLATGALTLGARTDVSSTGSPATLAIESSGTVLHVARQVGNTVSTFRIDSSTGGLTLLGSTTTANGPMAIASVP